MIVWLPSLGAPPLIDERVMTYEARKWIGLDPIAPWMLPIGGSGTWRPLTTYGFWLDAGLGWPLRHGIQLLLHGLLVGLSVLWLRTWVSARAAMIGGCFFAVHASHAATAGWIGGRADLLMAICAVGALLAASHRRWLLATLLAVAAVLFKETGVAVVAYLALGALGVRPCAGSDPGAPGASWGWLLPAAGAVGAFAVCFALTNVAESYRPGPAAWQAASSLWAPFAVELAVPWFVPVGVPAVTRDVVGIALAVPTAAAFVYLGAGRPGWQRGTAMAGSALLPVLHVLPNDGGQWYLLLPSLGIALAWADLAEEPRLRNAVIGVVALTAVAGTYEAVAWQRAAVRVEAALPAQIEQPTREDPRTWPHRGPSFCCGVPYQVQEDPPPGWGPITEPAPADP